LGDSRLEALPEGFAGSLQRYELGAGDVIADRFQIVSLLGNGGMGQVFVATSLAIGVKVAIKLLKPELLANPEFRARFQHEAEAVAAIQHPNVARFLDLVVGDPTFLVMEYVEGPTLFEVLTRERRLAVPRAVAIATRLCWALEAAHKAGVIHRDLKPTNVILTPDNELGEAPKLIDFGLAKTEGSPMERQLTRAGQLVGTPHYMSPEQISGQRVDARADIYSLACVLYEMLAGRPPFADAEDDLRMLYRHINEPPQPISRLVPSVPAALEAVLTRALAKRPEERFASMAELARALGEAVVRRRAAPPRPRRWPGLLATASIAALLVGGASFALRRAPAPTGLAGSASLLIVTSNPPGASIELDGKPTTESTPAALQTATGAHSVRLSKAGRTREDRNVSLERGEHLVLDVALRPTSHPLEVRSSPTGALVFLDGILMTNSTPAVLQIVDDDLHELRLELAGYETLTTSIEPDDREPTKMYTLQFEKRPTGRLMVDADAPTEVWVDGVDTGFVTPTLYLPVTVGPHAVELRGAGGRTKPHHVQVHTGETVRLMLKAK
jgi:serine/threonine-protein kinase